MANLRQHPRLRALLLLTLATVLLTSPVVHASPAFGLPHAKRNETLPANGTSPANATEECGFEGDSDTYGLGIRIGLYFQWITSALAYSFVPEEAVTMRGVNNCFQAAMFAGLLFLTITKGTDLYAAEAYLMLLFCMGGVCSATSDSTVAESPTDDDTDRSNSRAVTAIEKKFAFLKTSTLGGFVRLLLGCCFNGYGLWFIFHGMDHMQATSCSRYAFFFAKVDLFGWFRTFLKILLVLSAIPAGISFVMGLWALKDRTFEFWGGGWRDLGKEDAKEMKEMNTTPPSPTPRAATTTNPQFFPPPFPTRIDSDLSEVDSPVRSLPLFEDLHRIAAADRVQQSLEEVEHAQREADLRANTMTTQASFPTSGALGTSLPLFIIAVELTIKWNKIGNVGDIGSTGQLLPVIIGVGGLWRVGYAGLMEILTEFAKRRRGEGITEG